MRISVADRRRAPRIAAEFELHYKLIRNANGEEVERDEWITSRSANISESGIGIYCDNSIEVDDVIELKFTVEDHDINSFCSVIWTEDTADGFRAGLEFEFLSEMEEYAYLNFIRNFLRKCGLIK